MQLRQIVYSCVSDPVPFHLSARSGSGQKKNQAKSWKISIKKSIKIIRISYIFFKTIKLMLTDIYIYPLNNKTDLISEKYIFLQKKVKQKLIFSRFQVGFGAGSGIISKTKWNGSEALFIGTVTVCIRIKRRREMDGRDVRNRIYSINMQNVLTLYSLNIFAQLDLREQMLLI